MRGSGCRPTIDDLALRTGITTIRRPDVPVECGEPVRDTDESRLPRLVVETRFPRAMLYRRAGEGWGKESFEALDAVIDRPAIGARLASADIDEDVVFEPGRPLCLSVSDKTPAAPSCPNGSGRRPGFL